MLQGKRLGVVGTGAIGARWQGSGARSVWTSLAGRSFNPGAAWGKRRTRFVSFETLLRESHVVSLHVRLSDDSRGLIGAEQLAMMRSDAIL